MPWSSQPLDEWASKHATGKFIELDGIRTHYIEKGAGAPVILMHGFFFDNYMWNQNIDILAERYKVYAYDLWGFGYSTREPLDYGYPLYSKQLGLFMDAMGIPSASLVGQSLGGGTIINYTVSNRSRVDRIVLVDSAGMPNPLPIMGRISNLPGIGELMYGLRGDFMRRFTLASTFIHDRETITQEFYENATRFQKIKGSTEVMLGITRKQFFDTLQTEIEELGEMNVPTLIIWGRQEKAIPLDIGSGMHGILRNSRLEVIDNAAHCPNIDQPQVFNKFVMEFLADTN